MLTEPTMEKLTALGLSGMAAAFAQQKKDTDVTSLSFEERLGLLVDAEWTERHNRRLQRHLREAKLRMSRACIEDIDYPSRRGLDRSMIRSLATCQWVTEHQSIVITGATGVGKTFISCALAHQACRKGYRALYRRVPRLFDELTLARAAGSYSKLLARFARMDVLVLEDWGLTPIGEAERRDLLEIMEDRYGLRSTIVTSQFPVEKWHDHIGDPSIADAICDRLLHNAHKIVLKGPSRRKEDANRS